MARTRPITVVVAARGSVREMLRGPVTDAGIDIAAEASDLAGALRAVARRRPLLCVLDRGLPGVGVTTIAALTTPRQRPKVLVIGGAGGSAGIRADRLAGAARSLPGAPDGEAVVAALRELATEVR